MDADTKGEDSWQRCGELEVMWDWLYDMVWENVALESMRVACCPYGGPTAMVRDNRKMVLLRGATAPPLVRIFNCAGHEMGRFMWSGTQVVSMGWSQEQELLLVDPKGQVRAFSVHGRQLPLEFSLGEACETEGIADCCVYSSGVVVLTQANHIWAVTDINEPRPQRLADPPLEDLPRCMDVLVTQNPQGVEVILGCADGIVVADAQQAISPDRMLPDDQTLGAVSIIAISPNGEFVALFVESGALIVMLQDFTTTLLPNFTPPIDGQPLQMAWCGNDAIVLYYDGVLMLVSSTGDWVTFNSPEPVVLASEPDGLRVISTKRHRLLRSVDDAMRQVLSPESEGPGRQLFLARQAFDEQDAKADKILRGIKSDLQEAVQTCVEVAGAVWDTNTQRSVLKAACYGRAFCNQFPSHTIYEMCQKLRVLNAVRDAAVGWPLTMAQMDTLTLPVVISRLVNAHHHLLALRICKELDMDQGTVLHHWAKARISADESTTSNEELKNILAGKLKACPFVHYATIAEHAQAQGRRELAAQLLDDETCAAKQVPLLLELEEEQRALEKAVESGDTHLVYLALFRIYHRTVAAAKGMPEFIKAISSKPAAYALFMKYCKAQSPNLAEQIYNLDGNTEGLAEIKFNEALSTSLKIPTDTAGEETVSLSNLRDRVVSQLRDCAAQYAKSRKHEFQSKSAEEFANLRKEQAKLQLSTGRNMFLSLSVIDTIRQCIRLGYNKGAADIRRQFGISDKHFYWVKVRTLAERGQWEGLEVFAQERRPPIGWEPFIQACVDHNAPRERTGKFIDRLPDSEAKVEWYTKVGLNLQAARTAESLQSIDLMTRVQGIVGPNSQLGMKTAQMIERVKGLQPR